MYVNNCMYIPNSSILINVNLSYMYTRLSQCISNHYTYNWHQLVALIISTGKSIAKNTGDFSIISADLPLRQPLTYTCTAFI